MADFLALQEFEPLEAQQDKRCIWCGKPEAKNRSHIIPRKLTRKDHAANVLTRSVCERCNNNFSKLELWVLRNTPMAWVRVLTYVEGNRRTSTKTVLSYFYATEFADWLVYSIGGERQPRHILPQLVLGGQNLWFISEDATTTGLESCRVIRDAIGGGHYIEKVTQRLPDDFSPRALLPGGQVIVVAQDKAQIARFKRIVLSSPFVPSSMRSLQPASNGSALQHFRWSGHNWGMFCAKIAFESLCLFEGAEFCLRPQFNTVRSFATSNLSSSSTEIVFNEHGPLNTQDTPSPTFFDLTVSQNSPRNLEVPLIHPEAGMHVIDVFQVDGWVCSAVSVAGFPSTVLVLSDPSVPLNDFYTMLYDEQEDSFHYLKLAFDEAKPVIPMRLEGQIDIIARNYGLKHI